MKQKSYFSAKVKELVSRQKFSHIFVLKIGKTHIVRFVA